MSHFPALETDRLLLREIVISDAKEILSLHSNKQAMRWYGSDPILNIEQAENLIETAASWRQMPNPGTRWALQSKEDGRLLGSCFLFKWNRGWNSCSIGFELAAFAWGNGLMTEALSAILAWGFRHMELNRIEALVHPENAASIQLLGKQGFIQEGHLHEAGFWLGEYHDLLIFSLLRKNGTASPNNTPFQP
ncbi:GNAT family N-acetyltransferase [Uliginosibacterium gangwonense]|uniref:GNAT family N-acetyltransferase n=1 Tax=Uliginosibacterium gangwonense TaxID=392736 RepID=UPI0003796B21|nr:GNAT family protein [Uliginosibacterium gangwonense]